MKLLVAQLVLVLLAKAATGKPAVEKRSATGYAYPEPGADLSYRGQQILAPDRYEIKHVEAVGFNYHGSGIVDDDEHHSRISEAEYLFEGSKMFPYYGYQLGYGDQHQTLTYPLASRGSHVHQPRFGTDMIGLHVSFPSVFAGGNTGLDDFISEPFSDSYYGLERYSSRTPDTDLSYSGFLVEGTGPLNPGRAHYPRFGSYEGLHSSYPGPGAERGITGYEQVGLNRFADKYSTGIVNGGYAVANDGYMQEGSKKHYIRKRSTRYGSGDIGDAFNKFASVMIEDSSFGKVGRGYEGYGELSLGDELGRYGNQGWAGSSNLGGRWSGALENYGGAYDGKGKELIKVPVKQRVTVERPYPVDEPKPVDRPYPVEIKTPVDRPYPYEVQKPYPEPVRYPIKVEVPISEPYPVVIPKPVQHPYPVVVEKQVPVSEPYPFKVRVPVEKSYSVQVKVPVLEPYPVTFEVPVDKPYPVYVEKEVPVPEPYPVEIKVPVPVYVPKPYPVQVKIPVDEPYPVEVRVPVPDPYPVTVEKDVPIPEPYPVEKRIPVNEPYPVEVKVPVDHPYAVPVPKPYPVQERVAVPKPYPVQKPVPYPVEKTITIPKDRPYPVPVAKPYPVPVKVGKGKGGY